MDKVVRWAPRNVSAVLAYFKKPKGFEASGYFYTGPTRHFGHNPPRKSGKGK